MVGYRKKLNTTDGEYPFVRFFTFESTSVMVFLHYGIFNALMIILMILPKKESEKYYFKCENQNDIWLQTYQGYFTRTIQYRGTKYACHFGHDTD